MAKKHTQYALRVGGKVWRKPQKLKGRWRVRVLDEATGKVQMQTLEAATFAAARDEVHALAKRDEAQQARQKELEAEGLQKVVTVREALNQWLSLRAATVRTVTFQTYKQDCDLYARKLGEDRPIHEVRFSDVDDLFNKTWQEKRGRTLIKHRAALKRFFSWCRKRGYTLTNPVEDVEIEDRWRKEHRRSKEGTGKALSEAEARRLLANCPEPLWLLVFIMLRSGLRLSNVIGLEGGDDEELKPALRWSDIDLDEGVLRLPPERMKNDLEFIQPLHEELWDEFAKRRAALKVRRLAEDEPVVPPVNRRRLYDDFARAVTRARLSHKHLRLHDCRHTFADWLGDHCPEKHCAFLLGHAKGSITQRYWHRNEEKLREAINRLPRLISSEKAAETKTATE